MQGHHPTAPVRSAAVAALLGAALALAGTAGVAGCGKGGGTAAPHTPSELFATACARCHGADGRGGVASRPGAPPPRDFTDPKWQTGKSDRELARIIARGNGEMPGFSNTLTPAQIDGLVAFLRTLRVEEGK